MDRIVKGIVADGDDQCRFDYRILEKELKNLIRERVGDENARMEEEEENMCPTFVVTTSGLHAEGPATVIRSYTCTGAGPLKCAIWEGARATSASPLFFKPIFIATPPPGRRFVNGGLQYNNPSDAALREGQRLWPKAKRFCLISIGTGRQKSVQIAENTSTTHYNNTSLSRSNTWAGTRITDVVAEGLQKGLRVHKIIELCARLSQSSEHVHQRILRASQPNDLTDGFPYHRFSVDRDMEDVELQEWNKHVEIADHTINYMSEGEGEYKRNECVKDLMKQEKNRQAASITHRENEFIPKTRVLPPATIVPEKDHVAQPLVSPQEVLLLTKELRFASRATSSN